MNDIEFSLNENQYRIHRPDSFNLSIQRLGGKTWRTQSYHGSSLHSLANGLMGLITDNYIPDPELALSEQLDRISADVEAMGKVILQALAK